MSCDVSGKVVETVAQPTKPTMEHEKCPVCILNGAKINKDTFVGHNNNNCRGTRPIPYLYRVRDAIAPEFNRHGLAPWLTAELQQYTKTTAVLCTVL